MSLAKKGALLLLIPVVIQSALLVALILLNLETEFYPQRASQDMEVGNNLTLYVLDYFRVLQYVKRSIAHNTLLEPACSEHLKDLAKENTNLGACYQQFSSRRSRIILIPAQSRAAMEQSNNLSSKVLELGMTYANNLVQAMQQAGLSRNREQSYRQTTPLYKLALAVVANLTAYDNRTAVAPEKQSQMRQSFRLLIFICSIVNLGVVLAIGVFFIGDIFKRLNTILINVERIVEERELEPHVAGNDEVSNLDGKVHALSEMMNQTVFPYKTMLENAQDLICSIDTNGRMLDVSRASVALLGYAPNELTGRWIHDLIEVSNQNQFSEKFLSVSSGTIEPPFETRMICQDDSVVDVLWSLSKAPQEKTIFGVGHDITEIKVAERFQQDVVQMVSHDLKSPLTSITNFHELLESGVYGPLQDKYLEQVGVAKRSAERMLILVNDLLAVERMQSNTFQLDCSQVEVMTMFKYAVESVISLAQEKQITISTTPTSLSMFADERRIVQVLTNLLSNAIKFAPEHTTVTLSARASENGLEISVADQGRGIPEDMLAKIFDRFSQVERSDAVQMGGSGLGLAICKALIEQHGGTVSVISKLGEGCIFTLRIPQRVSQ
ncbi:MAG TPA: ATP-binding protein [Drouetiella sp.]